MRKKKLVLNTITSLVYQMSAIICGFIVPHLIIKEYGSEINGLVNSITQFLSVISFLEFGIGAVVQSALYSPLAEQDNIKISEIITSANKFFMKLAKILGVYIIILVIFYPFLINNHFDWIYTAILIISISISSFAQYYFGIVDRLLLTADQRGYIQYIAQTITIVINMIACVFLIEMGAGIHLVKLVTSLVYLFRPFALRMYVNQNYNINRKIIYSHEPLKQKWNGIAQHIASVVLTGTDVIVLSLFSTLENVSIYSVYNLVMSGIKQLFTALNSGFHALIGDLWAKQEWEKLNQVFGLMEWFIHTIAIFVFGCTLVLILPFVSVYTNGISDIAYIQPVFAVLITLSYLFNCISVPYHAMILAAGHYRQTQMQFIISALLNIIISIGTVFVCGLIGVAMGTLIAMIYQVIWMTHYVNKHLVRWSKRKMIKQFATDFLIIGIGFLMTKQFVLNAVDYFSWILLAIKDAVLLGGISCIINAIFYRNNLRDIIVYIIFKVKNNISINRDLY